MCSQRNSLGPRGLHSALQDWPAPQPRSTPGKRQCKYFPKRQRRLTGIYTLTLERWENVIEKEHCMLSLTAFLLEEFIGHIHTRGKLSPPQQKGKAEKLDS